MEKTYHVSLGQAKGSHCPTIEADFGRVNVILGVNGAGKSTLIDEIKKKCLVRGFPDVFRMNQGKKVPGSALSGATSPFGDRRAVVYVEGGRVVRMPQKVEVDAKTYEEYGTLEKATLAHETKRTQKFTERITDALLVLLHQGDQSRSNHSVKVTSWIASGKVGECPEVEELPLERLFLSFNKIFRDIVLEIHGGKLSCRRGAATYSPASLSDGERQVLAILADVALLSSPDSVVLVDEPELNLHPSLANRLWEQIESDLPQATFVYATHSVSFAMRQGVSKIFVLGSFGSPAVEVSSVDSLDADTLREFLGAAPTIVSSSATLITEGIDSSFDASFYRWILGPDEKVNIVPLRGCADVVAASSRSGIWSRLGSGVSIVGVSDRDFRSDRSVANISSPNCVVLELHEAESYITHPDVISVLGARLGLVNSPPSRSEVLDDIRQCLESSKVLVAAKRTFDRTHVRLAVAFENTTWNGSPSATSVREMIGDAARREVEKARDIIGERASDIFDEELARCEAAIAGMDAMEMLRLVPGKALLFSLLRKIGCRDSSMAVNACARHLNVEDFPHLSQLRKDTRAALAVGGGRPSGV